MRRPIKLFSLSTFDVALLDYFTTRDGSNLAASAVVRDALRVYLKQRPPEEREEFLRWLTRDYMPKLPTAGMRATLNAEFQRVQRFLESEHKVPRMEIELEGVDSAIDFGSKE